MSRNKRYPAELRERAVRMVAEAVEGGETEWAAMRRIAELLGVGSTETVRKWVRQQQVDAIMTNRYLRTETVESARRVLEGRRPRTRCGQAQGCRQCCELAPTAHLGTGLGARRAGRLPGGAGRPAESPAWLTWIQGRGPWPHIQPPER